MALIATTVQPSGVARIFFDLRLVPPDPKDEERIAEAIEAAGSGATPDRQPTPFPHAA